MPAEALGEKPVMPWSLCSNHLRYDVGFGNGRATVRFAGELDLASARTAHRALQEAAGLSTESVLDLSRVTFIDAAGLRFLLAAQHDARAASHTLRIRRPHRAVRRLFDLAGVLSLFDFEDPDSGSGLPESDRDVVAISKRAIDLAMRIGRADMANAQLLDPHSRSLRIVAQDGFNSRFLEFFETVDDEESACGSALAGGRSVWVSDITRSQIFADTPALDVMLDAGSHAVASVPVVSPRGRLLAMISTHYHRRSRWTEDRKLELENLAAATGRLLHDLMPTDDLAPSSRLV